MIVVPGSVQPLAQHLPGWRLRVMGRLASASMPRSSRRSTRASLSPTGELRQISCVIAAGEPPPGSEMTEYQPPRYEAVVLMRQ